ncbi:MAG: putative aminopeptidase [Arenicella sp.]|jgi:predicted aminopeptidase
MNALFSLIKIVAVLLALAALCGCSSIAYYGQSVIGHSKLMLARVPIDKAIVGAQHSLDDELASQLLLAKRLRRYSIDHLGLPDNSSYSSYVDLDRDFPVWTVIAAEEFSINAKQWCYPVIGCASYRGYFAETSAQEYAESQQTLGLETTIGAAGAYSTLGWFADPLLPSMMRYGAADFAETLFHELAHQQLYINGDSGFNESFATVVGEQGALQWLAAERPDLLVDYQNELAARDDFSTLLARLKKHLAELYASSLGAEEMRKAKQTIFIQLKKDYQTLKLNNWQGLAWYDAWFEQEVNNARIAAFGTYRDQVPEFERLLADCMSNFKIFYASLKLANHNQQHPIIPKQCNKN